MYTARRSPSHWSLQGSQPSGATIFSAISHRSHEPCLSKILRGDSTTPSSTSIDRTCPRNIGDANGGGGENGGGGTEEKWRNWDLAIKRRQERSTLEVQFVPFSVEVGGAWGPAAKRFFNTCVQLANDDRDIDLYHWSSARFSAACARRIRDMHAVPHESLEVGPRPIERCVWSDGQCPGCVFRLGVTCTV